MNSIVTREEDIDILTANPDFKKIDNDIVLLMDHNVDFVTNIKSRLEEEGYHVIIALTVMKGFELFYDMKPNFVMIDCDITGIDSHILEGFLTAIQHTHTPVALVSKETTLKNRIKAYEMGATDYINKNIVDPAWFIPYLKNRLTHQQKILIDELTGVYNRRYMDSLFDEIISDYQRHGDIFTIGMLDLDRFKTVNDRYGHLVGDVVLQELVKTIQMHTRKTDDICRFGGEEFVISLPRTTAQGALLLIEQIREDFEKRIFTANNETFQVTFSSGIVSGKDSNLTKDQLINEADQALYQAKTSGRNCSVIYSQNRKKTLEKQLHVIIVDDNRLIRTMLEQNFKHWHPDNNVEVVVHTYVDGVEFLDSDWYRPDDKYIILLDGIMPRMDGTEVLMRIREVYPVKNIVISMLSARSSESSIVHALEKGADDYILKPFKIPEVIARVGRLARRMLL